MIIIAYDISSDKRRNKVFQLLKDYGTWKQFSLFECKLEQEKYLELKNKLKKKINPSEDSIKFYFMCSSCVAKSESLGSDSSRRNAAVIV